MVMPRARSSGALSIIVVGGELGRAAQRQHLGDRGGQGGLAVVDVPDRAHVHMRLGALKFLLRHYRLSPLFVNKLLRRHTVLLRLVWSLGWEVWLHMLAATPPTPGRTTAELFPLDPPVP